MREGVTWPTKAAPRCAAMVNMLSGRTGGKAAGGSVVQHGSARYSGVAGTTRMKLPRNFFKPLAVGAPAPLRELPLRLERMIHFVPPHIEKVRARVPDPGIKSALLGNLEDAILPTPEAARRASIAKKSCDFGNTDQDYTNALQRSRGARRHRRDRRHDRRQARWSSCCRKSKASDILLTLRFHRLHGVPGSVTCGQEADSPSRHSGNRGRREQCRLDRHRVATHARHQPRPRRSRCVARHEDNARRRRAS